MAKISGSRGDENDVEGEIIVGGTQDQEIEEPGPAKSEEAHRLGTRAGPK